MRRSKGFKRAADLMSADIRRAAESRGFAESRLLTEWPTIAGREIAAVCRPVKVGYPRGRVGAVLTLLTTGANAPMLQMMLPQIRDRVNATYGYAAISRVDITQTAPGHFAEGQADFTPRSKSVGQAPSPKAQVAAAHLTGDIKDVGLRASLERLAANVISKRDY